MKCVRVRAMWEGGGGVRRSVSVCTTRRSRGGSLSRGLLFASCLSNCIRETYLDGRLVGDGELWRSSDLQGAK